MVNEAISNLKLLEGPQGPRGLKGKDGNDFNLEDHKDELVNLIQQNLPTTFELTAEQKLELKGEPGLDGKDGRDGRDFDFESYQVQISEIISKYISELAPSLKLTFNDLTEEEKDSLRGPRGQRGKPGKDFSLEEAKSVIEEAVADSVMALAPDLKLKFDDLNEKEKDSLKLKFEHLTEEEIARLRGPRGQRGKQGQQGIQGENGKDGKDGKDGVDGKSIRGPIGPQGLQGLPGRNGVDGVDGKDAPVITDIETVQEGREVSLLFQFDNGQEILSNPFELPKSEQIYNVYTSYREGGTGGGGTEGEPLFEQTVLDTNEPTGFVNRTDSFIQFNEADRRFVIGPTDESYAVYVRGTKLVINETKSQVIPDESGSYYFFIDSSGNLQVTTEFNLDLITKVAYCSYIYFDAEDGKAVTIGDERHGITMDGATHVNLHTTRGTQLVSGGEIAYSLGDGSLDSDMEVSVGNMRIADEDIVVDIINSSAPTNNFEQKLSPIAYIPIWYRQGDIWKKTEASAFPAIAGTQRAKFNEFTGTTWQLTDAPSNNKVLVTYLFATTSIIEPVIGILGQAQYQNLAEAQIQAGWGSINFGELPSPEMKLLYTLYYETSTNYDNSIKSRIIFVEDDRYNYDKPLTSSALNNNHSELLNLEADDHPQYLNEERGDARYYTQEQIDQIVADLVLGETGISVLFNDQVMSSQANTLNYSSDFQLTTLTYMSDWELLSEVQPGLSTYNSPAATQVGIGVKDKFVLEYRDCDPSVYEGAFVRINNAGLIVNAQADSKANSKVLGMVEAKFGTTVCNVRIGGVSTLELSGLDTEDDYYLSPFVAGGKTAVKPSVSGQYVISLGQALSDKSFLVDIGTRTQI